MAISTIISPKELERQAVLAYEGETLKVMLCQVGLTGYTSETSVADWQSVEISGNGYVRYSEVIGVGSYSGSSNSYLLPSIDAEFAATGAGFSFDRVIIYVDGSTYPHSILVESSGAVLLAGQTQTYRLLLEQSN